MIPLVSHTISRRTLVRGMLALGGVVTVPSLLASCSSDDEASSNTGDSGGSTPPDTALSAGLPGSISSLDVTREAGILNYAIALLCQESLLGIDRDGALVPALASSWSQPDPVTYVYELREGVTFSDGTPLTVEDVLSSLEVNTAEGSTSALAYAFTGIESATKTGDLQLTIVLSAPNASFGWTLSPGTFQVSSKAFLAAHKDTIGTPDVRLLGTGPYMITEFAPDSHVTLVANPTWWGGNVEVQELRVDFIGEENTRLLAMREGSIDIAMNVGLDQVDQWKGLNGVEVLTTTDNSLVTLAFNTTKAPWDDLHVRTAVAHCVDRDAIVTSLLAGQGEVAVTLPTARQWGGLMAADAVTTLYSSMPTVTFDIDAAKAELAQSAVPDGFADTITYPNSGPQIGTALLSLAENLRQIGIALEVREITLEQWIAELGSHASGIILGWYFATTGDPSEYAQMLLNSAYVGTNGTNIADYTSAAVTDLLDRAQLSTDPTQRGDLLGQALVASAADLPYFPLWWGAAATAFGPRARTDSYGPYFFIGPWASAISVNT